MPWEKAKADEVESGAHDVQKLPPTTNTDEATYASHKQASPISQKI
jgi:hypothetical protein